MLVGMSSPGFHMMIPFITSGIQGGRSHAITFIWIQPKIENWEFFPWESLKKSLISYFQFGKSALLDKDTVLSEKRIFNF